MRWISATVKRVVRSTLPAAAYGVSEAAETRELLRRLIENLLSADGNLNKVENSALRRPLHVATDNLNLCLAVLRDKSSTADKRLPMWSPCSGSSARRRTWHTLRWSPAKVALADGLTKRVC